MNMASIFLTGIAPLLAAAQTAMDERAEALLQKVIEATRAVKTVTVDVERHEKNGLLPPIHASLKLKRPDLVRFELPWPDAHSFGPFSGVVASDGQTVWVLDLHRKMYQEFPCEPENLAKTRIDIVDFLINPDPNALGISPTTKPRYGGREVIDGVACEVIEVADDGPMPWSKRLYIGPDNLICRAIQVSESKLSETTANGSTDRIVKKQIETVLHQRAAVQPLAKADFAFEPPKGAVLFIPEDSDALLIRVGERPPAFTLPLYRGGTVSLSELTKAKKLVLLNFWFYG